MIEAEFASLQARLRELWPNVTLRSIGEVERTIVVVHSFSLAVPDQLVPDFPSYEERFLCLVLSLLRAPRSRVIYVTSQPILPRLVDYYFGLVPDLDTHAARSRFQTVSLVDGSNRPLAEKLLERPGALARIRGMIGDPELALVLPFCSSPAEVELAVRLGIPLFGAHPDLQWLGTKQGSRQVFLEEDVPNPVGLDAGDRAELERGLAELRAQRPRAGRAIAKLNEGVSGLGNAQIEFSLLEYGLERALEPEDTEITVEEYLAAFDEQGGVVEELVQGTDFRSPSVQLQISPAGQVEILSTLPRPGIGRRNRKRRYLVGLCRGRYAGEDLVDVRARQACQDEFDSGIGQLSEDLRKLRPQPLAVARIVTDRPLQCPLAIEIDVEHRDRLPAQLLDGKQPLIAADHCPVQERDQRPREQHLRIGNQRPLQVLQSTRRDPPRVLRRRPEPTDPFLDHPSRQGTLSLRTAGS